MVIIKDALGDRWNVDYFRDYDLYDQGRIGERNRYLIEGVLIRPQGKIGLLYVDTPEEYKYILSVIKNIEEDNVELDLIDILEDFRRQPPKTNGMANTIKEISRVLNKEDISNIENLKLFVKYRGDKTDTILVHLRILKDGEERK